MPTYKKEKVVVDRLKHIHVPSGQKVTAAPLPSLLKRLVKRLFKVVRFFDAGSEPSLTGRIHELSSYAEDYHHQLLKIKKSFSKETDPESYTFVEAIIDPLLKEWGAINAVLHEGNIALQAKAFKKYSEWIDRARVWVSFHGRVVYKQEIIDAVVHHLIGAALTCIDRDIQIIRDYQVHQLTDLGMPPEEKKKLAAEMKRGVHGYLDRLRVLKQRPEVISLEGLGEWKIQIDECRQLCFEKALHFIDALVEREAPLHYSAEANEHLFEVISEITYLEREATDVLHEVERGEFNDKTHQDMIADHLSALAEEVHLLSLDLRLGWDLIARLQRIGTIIETAQQKLLRRH